MSGVGFDWTVVRVVLDVLVLVVGAYVFITQKSTASRKETEQKISDSREETSQKISANQKDTDEKIKSVCADLKDTDDRVARHSERISALEENARCAPNHEDLGKMYEKINGVDGSVKEMVGIMNGLTRNVGLIHKFLLESGNGKKEDKG